MRLKLMILFSTLTLALSCSSPGDDSNDPPTNHAANTMDGCPPDTVILCQDWGSYNYTCSYTACESDEMRDGVAYICGTENDCLFPESECEQNPRSGCDNYVSCTRGETFTDPRFDGDAVVGETDVTVSFVWEPGTEVAADLDDSYFENMNSDNVTYEGNRRATLTLEPVEGSSREYSVVIRLPDRRDYVDCQHPGTEDTYVFSITFTVSEDGAVSDATFEETIRFGNI